MYGSFDSLKTNFNIDLVLLVLLRRSSEIYDFTQLDDFNIFICNMLPTTLASQAEGKKLDLTKNHPSLTKVQENNTAGGVLVRKSLINLIKQLGNDLPIYLTPKGIESANLLTDMLNALVKSDKFKCDARMFSYLSATVDCQYKLHFDITSSVIKSYNSFNLPLKQQIVPNADDSGIYGFFINSEEDIKVGLGSAISCRGRVVDHMASFNGHRTQQFMHKFVMAGEGLNNLKWSPLITTSNLVHNWNVNNISSDISLGASKILRGFAQFPLRVLEQGMMDKYKPYLNPNAGQVTFFNFSFSKEDFYLPLSITKKYQVFDSSMSEVLAQGDSYNSLAKLVGLSNVSVRNNMNWHLGCDMVINGKEIHGYLRETGVSLRTEYINQQLLPKDKYPLVELSGRTLYDLIPGKLHAITTDSLKDYCEAVYDNELDLWTSLNPSTVEELSAMKGKEIKQYLNNRVGRYMNIARPEGNSTERGNFFFCRHPDYLAGLAKVAEGIFAVNIVTSICTYYANISQISRTNRTGVRNHLNKGTLYNNNTRLIYSSDFLNHIPEAKGVSSLRLTTEQLDIVHSITPRKVT